MGSGVDKFDNTTNNTGFPYKPVDGQTVSIDGVLYYFDEKNGAWLRSAPKWR